MQTQKSFHLLATSNCEHFQLHSELQINEDIRCASQGRPILDVVSWRTALINHVFIPLRLEIFKTITIGGSEDLPQYKSEHQRQNK